MSTRASRRAALAVLLVPLLLLAVVAGAHRNRPTAYAAPPKPPAEVDRSPAMLAAEGPLRLATREESLPVVPFVPEPATAPASEQERGATSPTRIAGWIADLSADDVRRNAFEAVWQLRMADENACAPLEHALDSPDDQQRFLAAGVLRYRNWKSCGISDRLIEVTIEGLRDDRWRERVHPFIDNATEGVDFLIQQGERAWSFVLPSLGSSDSQERFLAAVVLGYTGCTGSVERTAGVLAEQMNDDAVKGNAVIAASALLGLGTPAADSVEWIRRNGDAQAAALARIVLLDLATPPETASDFRARRAMHAASKLDDPAQLEAQRVCNWVGQLEDRLPR